MHHLEDILLALTPMERWKATQQLHTGTGSTYWLMLATGAVLVLLVLLLAAVSARRRAESRRLTPPEPAAARPPKGPAARYASSRSIPVGGRLELMHPGQEAGIEGQVVRNDDIELAIEPSMSLETRPGESWRVRCCFGMSVWEFDTTAVRGENGRLILHHSDAVRYTDRRRFPRVTVNSPALVAHLPFLREDAALREEVSLGGAATAVGPQAGELAAGAPTFVEALVTELAGPGLRLEASLQVEPEDMVLLVFALAESGQGLHHRSRRTLAAAGRVQRCQATERGMSMAVELSGLNDEETEELVRATREIAARMSMAGADAERPLGGGGLLDSEEVGAIRG